MTKSGRQSASKDLNFNFLAGICAKEWAMLLSQARLSIGRSYWGRARAITRASLENSRWRSVEENVYGSQIPLQVPKDPVFLLGHWRSGTTLLHELLALNTTQVAVPTMVDVLNPFSLLSRRPPNSADTPQKRPMDQMTTSLYSPQEDENALALMTLASPYLATAVPRRRDHFLRYLTFETVTAGEVDLWVSAFRKFAAKLTMKYGKTIVFKSPPHTARLQLLIRAFPEARFVHISRDPCDVFQSMMHLHATAPSATYLQEAPVYDPVERVLETYEVVYDHYLAQRTSASHRVVDLRFESLERDPLGTIRGLHEALGWTSSFATAEPEIRRYLDARANYQKNRFPEMTTELRSRIDARWGKFFDVWGYPRPMARSR